MSFSIVMLTYNNREKFERCMNSMFPILTRKDLLEIIILDNGSKDKHLISYLSDINKNFSKVKVFLSPKNLGVAGGRKKLYNMAKGEYIISVDSDVVFKDYDFMFASVKLNLKPLPWEKVHEKKEGNQLFLIGGGGGNHVHFPSIYMSDVVNMMNREKKNEFLILDEVAGWCQCFRKALLEKVEMDDRFHPFWGEDSDFCIQIKRLGGKCAIFGRGVIDHIWSTCRKEENRQDLMEKWEMVLEKWSDTREGFIFDKEYYSKLYQVKNPITDYFTNGIFHGKVYDKSVSTEFCAGEESLEDMEKYLTVDNLGKYYYSITESSLGGSMCEDLYIVDTKHGNFKFPPPESSVIYVHYPSRSCDTCGYKKQMHILLKVDIQDPYMILLILMDVIRKYQYNNVYLHNFEMKEYDKKYNRKGLRRLIRSFGNEYEDLPTQFSYSHLLDTYLSYPVQKMLRSALMIPFDYPNIVAPEYSPKHILPELFCRIYNDQQEKKILTIAISGDSDLVKKSIKYLQGDVLYIDSGYTISKIPKGIDWYHRIEEYTIRKLFKFLGEDFFDIYNYDVICLINVDEYKLVSDIREFYERSLYQNQCFVHGVPSIISFSIDDLDVFVKIMNFFDQAEGKTINNKPINVEVSVVQNIFEKIHFTEIWKKKVEEEVITYYRDDDSFSKPADFPLLQKECY